MDFYLRGVLPPPTLSSGIWCRALLGGLHPRHLFIIIHPITLAESDALGIHVDGPLIYLLSYTPAGAWLFVGIGTAVSWRCALLVIGLSWLTWRTSFSPNGLRSRHIFGLHLFFLLFLSFFYTCFHFFPRFIFSLFEFIYTYVANHPLYNSNS